MDETNTTEYNENKTILLLRQCLLLLDKYNHCLHVMSDSCKCDQNVENKLLFRDLLSKYQTIMNNNKSMIESLNTFEHNYCKFQHLFHDLSENENMDPNNDTINQFNECIEQNDNFNELVDENNGNNDNDLEDNDNNNSNDINSTDNNETIIEENVDITETLTQHFDYLSKNCLTNDNNDSIKDNNPNILEFINKTAIEPKKLKLKSKSKKTVNNVQKTKSKTNTRGKNLISSPLIDSNVAITSLIPQVFECDKCLQSIRIKDRVSHYRTVHNMFNDTLTNDKCFICEQDFKNRGDFVAHNKEHHSTMPFKCIKLDSVLNKVCGRVYGKLKDLNKHIKKTHCTEKPFKCSVCDKYFHLLKQLITHEKMAHNEKKFVCDYKDCEYKTVNQSLLNHHQKYHKEMKFQCNWNNCRYKTYNEELLDRHITNRHLTPITPKVINVETEPVVSDRVINEVAVRVVVASEKLYKCLECDKEYKSYKSFYSHANQLHRQHKYVCDWNDCQYSTSLKYRLLVHQKRHLQLKSVHCDWPGCESTFVSKMDLHLHYRRHKDCQFFCTQCNQAFKTSTSLRQHIKRAHTNERAFECEYCQKRYATKSILSQHLRICHIGKSHECDKCDFKSTIRKLLDIHNRRVHLRERTYRCDVQGCEGKSFFGKKDLLDHQMSIHSDERKFLCDWPDCGASFKLKSNLIVHHKCHTGTNTPRKRKRIKQ